MGKQRNLYRNHEWINFSEKVKARDGHKCLRCGRRPPQVVLQVHHEFYTPRKNPWEYALSDCLTLCKGCHAKEHGVIEPDSGWTLLSIDDLGSRTGTCERRGCGTDIQYEHLTYHPKRGYMVVGSTCIQHLTKKDRMLSANLIKIYRNVSAFAHQSTWEKGITKKRKPYIYATYNHHKIRIYGQEPYHAFQLHLKNKGERRYTFGEIYQIKNRSTLEAKELAYIALKGVLSTDTEEQDQLRNLYRELITSP